MLDINILITNIDILMTKDHVIQSKLAEIIGSTQPNVSKYLSRADDQTFTLKQVVAIASYFKVSVDHLLGLNHSHSNELSAR